jgi:hypothetical protein
MIFQVDTTTLTIIGTKTDSGLISFRLNCSALSNNFEGYTCCFVVKKNLTDPDSAVILEKEFTFGAAPYENIPNNLFGIQINPEDLADLDLVQYFEKENQKFVDFIWSLKIYKGSKYCETLIPSSANPTAYPKFRLIVPISNNYYTSQPLSGNELYNEIELTVDGEFASKTFVSDAISSHNLCATSHPYILNAIESLSGIITYNYDELVSTSGTLGSYIDSLSSEIDQINIDLATKLTTGNIKSGDGIELSFSGNDITIMNSRSAATWGNITGNIENQTDLYGLVSEISGNLQDQIDDIRLTETTTDLISSLSIFDPDTSNIGQLYQQVYQITNILKSLI